MDPFELLRLNLLSPVVLAFALGLVATAVKSDLKFPDELYTALSIYLLLAIGLKGGAELARTSLAVFWRPAVVTVGLGVLTPIIAYVVARRAGRLAVADAAALAAHYGSVSVVTFFAALGFLEALGVPAEPFLPTLVALLEIPAIMVALAIAHRQLTRTSWGTIAHEVIAGRSVFLLLGGLVIGYLAGADGLERVRPLFVDLFQGVLLLFLLDMGMVAARRLRDLRQTGPFLVAFAVVVPILHGLLGTALGRVAGLSVGGATVLGVLAASASYIAAPAAVRIALPQANPSLYLTAALGLTFPFNLTIGIPLFYVVARAMGA
ncbi:MAG: sodium-dependent bicarbonate transport family permease [Gemmatimonadota bacterium]|nr:sodium-dependent bicarbonate transport family permease [Gemmatimonadota bacterium]